MTQGERDYETRQAIRALASAVMSLAKDVDQRLTLSDETRGKVQSATDAVARLCRDDAKTWESAI